MIRKSEGGSKLTVGQGDAIQVKTGGKILPDSGTQPSAITKPVSTAATNSTPYGFATQAQADALVAAVRSIIDVLKNAGLTA